MARQKICSIDGCGNKHYCRDWCRVHYYRWWRQGDPTARKIVHGACREFVEKVAIPYGGSDCLIWPFAKRHGYAAINKRHYGSAVVSRIVCEAVHGPPPTDLHQAAHGCGNGDKGCVNPRHLRWATQVENEIDKLAHGTWRRGQDHASAKLTDADVVNIRAQSATHMHTELARMYGVNPSTIRQIVSRRNWRHLA